MFPGGTNYDARRLAEDPTQQAAAWQAYNGLPTPQLKAQWLQANPDLASSFRNAVNPGTGQPYLAAGDVNAELGGATPNAFNSVDPSLAFHGTGAPIADRMRTHFGAGRGMGAILSGQDDTDVPRGSGGFGPVNPGGPGTMAGGGPLMGAMPGGSEGNQVPGGANVGLLANMLRQYMGGVQQQPGIGANAGGGTFMGGNGRVFSSNGYPGLPDPLAPVPLPQRPGAPPGSQNLPSTAYSYY